MLIAVMTTNDISFEFEIDDRLNGRSKIHKALQIADNISDALYLNSKQKFGKN